MNKYFEKSVEFSDPEVACEVMDWLNDNGIKHDITLNGRNYAFEIVASRLQVAIVKRYFEEVL